MATFIIIDQGAGGVDTYATDTEEQIAAARVALAEAGLSSAPVYAGDPDCPDSYRNGQRLSALSPEEWAADLDLDEVAGGTPEDVEALVRGWRAIDDATAAALADRETISVRLAGDFPVTDEEWRSEAVFAVVARLYAAVPGREA